jgi:hypothetical protein
MTQYARVLNGLVERLADLTAQEYAALQANGKAASLRPWVVDAKPAVTAAQVADLGPIAITATEARQTWVIRSKTQAELDAEANAAELDLILAGIDLTTARIAAYNPTPDVTGTTAERALKLETRQKEDELQLRDLNRAARFLLRRIRSQM